VWVGKVGPSSGATVQRPPTEARVQIAGERVLASTPLAFAAHVCAVEALLVGLDHRVRHLRMSGRSGVQNTRCCFCCACA
jgi:hypothetical protein